MKKYKTSLIILLSLIAIVSIALYGVYLLNTMCIFPPKKIKTPKTYSELYAIIKESNDQKKIYTTYDGLGDKNINTSNENYSKTNVQVSGVDEADIVKTDGKYIYSLSNNYLYITEVNNGVINSSSKIKSRDENKNFNSYYQEMYIKDNKLIVIKNTNSYRTYDLTTDSNLMLPIGSAETSVVIFDITDKTKPIKINELSQSGYYSSSRLVDDYLYIITNQHVYDIKEDNIKSYVPILRGEKEITVPIEDILIAPKPSSNSYVTITGIDINDSKKHMSSKSILGSSSNIYADLNNIYIASIEDPYYTNSAKTNIMKFSMDKGILNLDATGEVRGTILNQFSMDEYNDYFRIVTTFQEYNRFKIDSIFAPDEDVNITKNNLYILDENLKQVGSIEGLAKGERVYSVRFDGDIGYFVTFKQVDPLFVVDLSNPKDPIIKTELKIPGFSEYLHVYNDKYLFGLGKDADEKGRVQSMKISMFDITNKNNVIEKYKTKIGDSSSWSEASYNHKAIIISKEKDIIAFPLNNKYVIYRFIDNDGFKLLKEVRFNDGYYSNLRGLYINDYLYVVSNQAIKTLNLNTLEEGKTLELVKYEKEDYYIEKDKPLY